MKKNFTELIFILDKSGSMSGLENDTIGGFNSMLENQKAVDGECRITTVLFDNSHMLLHDRIDIHAGQSDDKYRILCRWLHSTSGCNRSHDQQSGQCTEEYSRGLPCG